MARSKLPQALGELTPDWLTSALRAQAGLGDGEVVAVESEVLGSGQGFMGDVARLRLTVEPKDANAPASLIAKMPTLTSENRGVGSAMAMYEREVHFYEVLADRVGARTPHRYFADVEPDPAAPHGEALSRFIDRLPRWLIALIMRFLLWAGKFTKRRAVLLLEDMAPARVGDQVAGCSPEEAARVLDTLADVQARFWESPELDEHWWVASLDFAPNIFQLFFEQALEPFHVQRDELLDDEARAQIRWLAEHGTEVHRRLCAGPHTLAHGDFRLDNMFFDDATGEVCLFDWQGALATSAAYDVAYFVSGSLPEEVSDEAEAKLLRDHHAGLVSRGVRDYPFEQFQREYRLAMMLMVHRMVTTGGSLIDLGEDRGRDLIDQWLLRALRRTRGYDLEKLL
jgi:hypothetical protein